MRCKSNYNFLPSTLVYTLFQYAIVRVENRLVDMPCKNVKKQNTCKYEIASLNCYEKGYVLHYIYIYLLNVVFVCDDLLFAE